MERLDAVTTAKKFIENHFPNCQGAVLAGSVVRGEATDTSDLDIVIFDNNVNSSYRESLIELGWPIELFVHNLTSYKFFFDQDYKVAKPSLQRMVSEGIILKDEGVVWNIKKEADHILKEGPEEWSIETINVKRYFLTDILDDFIGAKILGEELLIANTLSILLHEFYLRVNKQWIGTSKWIIRALKQYDKEFALKYVESFESYYKTGKKDKVINLTDEVLEPFGGRLFDGFSVGKEKKGNDRKLNWCKRVRPLL